MKLKIYTSRALDGTMKTIDGNRLAARHNREKYLRKIGLDPYASTLHTLDYETDDFCRYIELASEDKGDGITRESTIDADAVVVTEAGHPVLLPLADCVGAVIHEPGKNILMVSHLGRHNLVQTGGTKCIGYLVDKYGVNPADLTVWLSPAAGRENYPLYDFDNRGMHEVATEQLTAAGVDPKNITISPTDVTTDKQYFSHSQFLKGNRKLDGRFCIVAVMTD